MRRFACCWSALRRKLIKPQIPSKSRATLTVWCHLRESPRLLVCNRARRFSLVCLVKQQIYIPYTCRSRVNLVPSIVIPRGADYVLAYDRKFYVERYWMVAYEVDFETGTRDSYGQSDICWCNVQQWNVRLMKLASQNQFAETRLILTPRRSRKLLVQNLCLKFWQFWSKLRILRIR